MTLEVWFISLLIINPPRLPEPGGWLQYRRSYSTYEACESHIKTHKPQIILSAIQRLGNIGVKKMECMTYEEAVKRNTALQVGLPQ